MTGTTWGPHGDHGDNIGWRQRRPQPWGPHGDLLGAMGMTGTMWGQQRQCGDDGDNVGTTKSLKMQ